MPAMLREARVILALIVIVGVILIPLAHVADAFNIDYIEIAYVDKRFGISPVEVREVAYKILSKLVDWNRVVYARAFLLDINGSPILYAKAFMVPRAPVTTTCTVITYTTTPVTTTRICKTTTTTAPLNAGFTYYPTSNGMEAVYTKAVLVVKDGEIVDIKRVDYYKTILGKELWDPIAIGAITAKSVWESQAVVEAIAKTVVAEHLKPKELWLSTAELVYPEEYIVSIIFLADDYIYGVIYDWDNHKILVAGLDIIEPPYYLPGQQHSMPTTTIATVPPTSPTTTPTITTMQSTITAVTTYTRTSTTSPPKLPPTATTTATVASATVIYGSATASVESTQTSIWRTTTTTTPSTTTTGSGTVYLLSETTSQAFSKALSTNSILIVATATIIVALVSWLLIRRILV